MAGSQSSWLDRLLFGGIGLSLLVHALVLFGGHTTGPVAVPDAGAVEELQHGRSLKQLNLGGGGGLTGTLGNLQVVSRSCSCACLQLGPESRRCDLPGMGGYCAACMP